MVAPGERRYPVAWAYADGGQRAGHLPRAAVEIRVGVPVDRPVAGTRSDYGPRVPHPGMVEQGRHE